MLVRKSPPLLCLLVALGSVILSCYPVIFFGKSFVSPNLAGSYMLYPTIPTLPAYKDKHLENTLGSDAGAMLWQNLPYSFIESRALLHDKQLPLWDRWNSCGTPLFGQGISMLGDPLNLFVIACRGAAWAWDIKFLLAKVLFCWAIGLCVFSTSKNLPSALILTVSSAFLGFFYHRFIHPAFFSFCYAPWILVGWLGIINTTSKLRETACAALLVLASWCEINSGTVKEGYMLLLSMHASGLLLFLLSGQVRNLRKTIHLLCALLSFVLLSAPVWLTFLYSLRQSFTTYSRPYAYQLQPALLLGFFDDIFYRALNPNTAIASPSANFFILLGVLFNAANFKLLVRDRTWRIFALSAVVCYGVTFGVLPRVVITTIPFVANVKHIDNVFSSVLIIYCVILAGFGLSSYFKNSDAQSSRIAVIGGLLLLCVQFMGFAQAEQSSPLELKPLGYSGVHGPFIPIYITSLLLCAMILPSLIRWRQATVRHRTTATVLTGLCLLGLHWRFGQHLNSEVPSIDAFVVNPQVRVNLTPPSPAIDFLRRQPAAFRAAGIGETLFPGYNAIAGIESIYGVDPLMNPFYRELLLASGVKLIRTWRWVVEKDNFSSVLPVYSLLNLRYFLAPRNDPRPTLPLQRVARLDLSIYENRSCWPRAFYTSAVTAYDNLPQFVALLRAGDGRPFAAVDAKDTAALSNPITRSDSLAQRNIVPARDYLLRSNDTSFTIDAPGPGVVVLTEPFLARDFIARVNGAPASYFRVNHAFRGIEVPRAGVYRISFSYWPPYFTTALLLSGFGLVLLLTWLVVSVKVGQDTAITS